MTTVQGKNPFEMLGKLMMEVGGAMAKAGVTEDELKGLKAKIEGGQKLAAGEVAKVKSFVDALLPAFGRIAEEFGDDGKKMADKMRGEFDALLAKVS